MLGTDPEASHTEAVLSFLHISKYIQNPPRFSA